VLHIVVIVLVLVLVLETCFGPGFGITVDSASGMFRHLRPYPAVPIEDDDEDDYDERRLSASERCKNLRSVRAA
jgi:hypothetical protein